ncbi:MAG: hypothetical protein WC900_00090 [Oscillospiraceae bacterium]|jgi:hypothetical protein
MILDLTLDSVKFPGLENYTPEIGIKKADNVGLTTLEGCQNIAKPWLDQRPLTISENSSFSDDIERNGLIEIDTASITLTMVSASFIGCELKIITTFSSGSATVLIGATSHTLNAMSLYRLVYDGTTWQFERQLAGNEAGLTYDTSRWLIFDFSAENRKSLKLKKGTRIPLDITGSSGTERRWLTVNADSSYDLASAITAAGNAAATRTGEINGRDFYVYLAPDTSGVKLVVSTLATAPSDIDAGYTVNNTRKIGQFHTLCADAGASLTATVAADPGSLSVNNYVMVKNYPADSDFYDFYNKKVTAVSTNARYDTVTVEHVLKGFTAGQILPESVWCLTFKPHSSGDGMIYDYNTDTAVDIYLQSGKGRNTKSVYGGTTTRTRDQQNYQADMNAVGKLLISDDEFTSAALGSNEKTAIYGSEASITTTGGHTDTASRRMISFLGVEDMCGGVWQWLRNVSANNGSNWSTYDGVGNFGQMGGTSNALLAGGEWDGGALCGSRCRDGAFARSHSSTGFGGRGVSRVVRGV